MLSRNWFCAIDRIFFAALVSSLLFISAAKGQTGDYPPAQNQPSFSEMQKAKFEKTLKQAKSGDAKEQFELSRLYRNGEGVEEDDKEADYWLGKAAENGGAQAQVELGESFVEQKDYAAAFSWFLKAAQAGDATAQSWTAELYMNGQGVEIDYEQAMQWDLKAAAQHNATAIANIGYLYEYGKGVAQDYEAAMKWYRLASDAGNVMAKENIGKLYMFGRGVPRDWKEAEHWLTMGAEQGLVDSQVGLAIIYLEGPPELKNPEKAVPLLESAVEQGNLFASAALAKLYLSNEVPKLKKDPARAMQLLRPAAEQGNVFAQLVLGAAEQDGKNYKAAESWYRKAAEQNEGRAMFGLADLYSRGEGGLRNFEEAAKLYVQANDLLENAAIANNAGWFFATCENPKYRNPDLAMKYGLRAVELSEGKNAGFLDTLAEAYFINEQYDHAVSTEERALELDSKNEAFKKSLSRFRAALDSARPNAAQGTVGK
jgi:uncharacterized protein